MKLCYFLIAIGARIFALYFPRVSPFLPVGRSVAVADCALPQESEPVKGDCVEKNAERRNIMESMNDIIILFGPLVIYWLFKRLIRSCRY
jgi:hypothetical protein